MDGCTDTMKKIVNMPFLWLCIGLGVNTSYANDSLAQLMQRIKTDTAVKMSYQEIRTLELMDQPWQGSGYMYAIPPHLMIKEQLQPQHVLMAVDGDTLFYFDPKNDVRHQGEMEEDNPLALNIAVFKALINADETLLNRMYLVDFNSTAQHWIMHLKPKANSESGFYITVSGLANQPANRIKIHQADGDLSEFVLQKERVGADITNRINKLYQTLPGE